jgi:hypothetical protein
LTEPQPPQSFAPMHPVTRIGRVLQQLRSFGDLHATELTGLADRLEPALGERVRAFAQMQRNELKIIYDELLDIRTDLSDLVQHGEAAPTVVPGDDPAANSPKRARWLAEQAEQGEPTKLSRRDLLSGELTPEEESEP